MEHYIETKKSYKMIEPDSPWTTIHLRFAHLRGFCGVAQDGADLEYLNERFSARILASLIQKQCVGESPIPSEELASRGKSNAMIKCIALIQIIWFGLQILMRAINHLHVTALEIWVVAFVLCSVITYGLYWNTPQDIEYQIPLLIKDTALLRSVVDESVLSKQRANIVVGIIGAVLFALFGAFHCIAWYSPFPTHQELIAWRVCAVAATGLGPLATLGQLPDDSDILSHIEGLTFLLTIALALLYALARLGLMVLAFTALRAQPQNVYERVDWNKYIPHWGS